MIKKEILAEIRKKESEIKEPRKELIESNNVYGRRLR